MAIATDEEKGRSNVSQQEQENKTDDAVAVTNEKGNSSTSPLAKPGKPPFTETLRLSFLRIVIASSILTMGYTIYGGVWVARNEKKYALGVLGILLTVVTTAHHLGTTFVPPARLPRWVAWLDISFTFLESSCYFAVVGYYTHRSRNGGTIWFPKIALLAVVAFWILAISLVVLSVLKVVCYPSSDNKKEGIPLPPPPPPKESPLWWKHFKEFFNKFFTEPFREFFTGPFKKFLKKHFNYPAHVLFGTRMWQPGVPGESKWITGLRGFIALTAVCALVSFGVYQAIIMPIGEMGMTPQRTYRTPQPDFTLAGNIFNSDMRFSVLLLWSRHPNATASLSGVVNATARWRQQGNGPIQLQPPVLCPVRNFALNKGNLVPATWDVAIVVCPPRPSENAKAPNPYWDFPNFDIRVDYTGLLGGPGAALSDRISDSVRVYLGLTRDASDVYLNTEPVSLFPGMNALSVANPVIRQRLRPATLATLGFESQENFLIASIAQTLPNTLPGVTSDPNVGTLGFTLQSAVNEWTILQDYRSKSVLSGLSALGGLGSFMSTMLALILGTSLARALMRSKPNSPFGFLHNIESVQKWMVDGCDKEYPALRADIQELEKKRGIHAYLFDTLIDVDTLGYGKQGAGASEPNGALNPSNGYDHKEETEKGSPEGHAGDLPK